MSAKATSQLRTRTVIAPRPGWVRRNRRLVRIDDAEDTRVVEERQRHAVPPIGALGDHEIVHTGDSAGSGPRRPPRAQVCRKPRTQLTGNTSLNRSRPATRRQRRQPRARATTSRRAGRRSQPPTPQPEPRQPQPPTPPRDTPVPPAPPAFIVPDPTDLDFHYPDDGTDAGDAPYVHIQPDVAQYMRLPTGLRQERDRFVVQLVVALGPRASADAQLLMAFIVDRCLIIDTPQGPDELANIVVGAAAVALAYDDSFLEVVPLLAEITGLGRALVARLQRVVLSAIGYRV
ncbi:hypothetical protein SeLEV6574_g02901 [Synchytrium endobioticum]|nr:hypothetical protein SeLEV6574_g02901 [Synchytrium endobioticum]